MRQLLPDGTPPLASADGVPDELAQILGDGMRVVGDCLVIGKSDAAPCLDSVRAAVMDKTGYECFVNHVRNKKIGRPIHAGKICIRAESQ